MDHARVVFLMALARRDKKRVASAIKQIVRLRLREQEE
jgi:hypothetical protein